MRNDFSQYHTIVVGAGISGATLAERYATKLGSKVLVIEKRDHIGGNCYDFINADGILVSKYGAHIFHTNDEEVWEYVNRFTEWRDYTHRVLSYVDDTLVPVPINRTTVNRLFHLNLSTEDDMRKWLNTQVIHIPNPQNSEESALSRVGKILYEKMFKNYTKKQWDVDPRELDASVLDRIPVRLNNDDRYFTDKYQAMPKHGYTKLVEKMLDNPNIDLLLNTDYFSIKRQLGKDKKVFFTGPIDRFFEYKYGDKLQYRSLMFEFETIDKPYYQTNSVINYPNDYEYTRIVEYKLLTGQKSPKTTISREYPTWEGEPYYPVLSQRNRDIYEKYQKDAQQLEKDGIYFVGRLANYKYFNMDQAFKNALDLFRRITTK